MTDLKRNSNIIRIKSPFNIGFFYKWLSFMSPINKLTKSEKTVLAALLYKRFELKEMILDENTLDNVLKSYDIRKQVRESIGYEQSQFNVVMSKLKRSDIIVDDKIDKRYIPNVQFNTDQYRLIVIFDVNENQ